jgi:hypothetical protein
MQKQRARESFSEKMREMYGEIETCYRPDLRWWLAEGLNTDETLRKNVREIYKSGFGAAEFLAMPEPGADSSVYGWGSEEWTNDTRLIISEVTKHGLGFSLTSGANWANANLPDTCLKGGALRPDSKAAAKELIFHNPAGARRGLFRRASLAVRVCADQQDAGASDAHGTAASYREHCSRAWSPPKLLTPGGIGEGPSAMRRAPARAFWLRIR